jgi:ethanolamine utilization protein EutN
MQLGKVIGHATATLKHPSFAGLRLVLVQQLNNARAPEADAIIAIDKLGSRPGDMVVLNSDGKGARELIGDEKTPARWWVIGIVDE